MLRTLCGDLVSNTVVIGTSLLVIETWHVVGSLVTGTAHIILPYLASSSVLVRVNINDAGQSVTINLCFCYTLHLIQIHCRSRRASWNLHRQRHSLGEH